MDDSQLLQIAERFGTPCYVYDAECIRRNSAAYRDALGQRGRAFYAVKANSNLSVLRLIAGAGLGFDIVSGGELARVLAAGGAPEDIVFSGVGKHPDELAQALDAGIACFNIESAAELKLLIMLTTDRLGSRAPVALRINPDIDAHTHPHITTGRAEDKFGIPAAEALDLCRQAAASPGIELIGLSCHLGSQIDQTAPLTRALEKMLELRATLRAEGVAIGHIDMGGGLAVPDGTSAPTLAIPDYIGALLDLIGEGDDAPELWLEPGRSITADAGALLTRVLLLKHNWARNFAVVDAAMNDLMRPALYSAVHAVRRLTQGEGDARIWQIAGPVCESTDMLAHDIELPLAPGDILALERTGAYGFSMSSNYNARARPCEALVDGGDCRLVRPRETQEELFASELEHLL